MEKITKDQIIELLEYCHKPKKSFFWLIQGYHLILHMRTQNENVSNREAGGADKQPNLS